MLTTGSKLLFGAAVAAAVGAVLYGLIEGGALGTVGLTFAAAALLGLGGVVLATRDANVSAMDIDAIPRTAASRPAPGDSIWPIVGALGALVVVVGLVTDQLVFILGLVILAATAAEWMVQSWSERASDDGTYNAGVRGRLAHPVEFPIFAALAAAVIVFSFSRIMLFLSKTGGPVAFGVIATLVLAIGFVFAARPTLRSGAIGAVVVVAVAGLVTGGIAAAIGGEREMEVHETVAMLGEHEECTTAEETHADDKASQTVAAKANIMGEITLNGDDTLTASALDWADAPTDSFVVARNNPTNVLFRNDSGEDRRLVLHAGTRLEDPADTTSDQVPAQYCTALVEEGGTQLLTFAISTTSAAATEPMNFTVPGVDGALVEVVVP
ncbi:MAG: hypothetical protein ACK5OX_01505 [Desertimonas sp.]